MNIGRILRDASNEIDKRGHVKEHLEHFGNVCALGAIGAAITGDPLCLHRDPEHSHEVIQVADFVTETLKRMEPQFAQRAQTADSCGSIATWNNHYDTSAEDVKLGFGIAANEWDRLHPQGDVVVGEPSFRMPSLAAYRPISFDIESRAVAPRRYVPVW